MLSQEEMFKLFNTLYTEKKKYITFEEVCKEVGCCEKTFRKWMKAENAFDSCPDVFRTIMKTIHNFDNLDEEAAYWIGYLMADGCLAEHGSGYTLMLECKTEDKEILEKFCDFINIRKDRITTGHKGASVALSLSDSNFSTSVQQYGIVPHKSHVETDVPLEILQNDDLFFQYLKGLMDGDGTVHNHRGSYGISVISNSLTQLTSIKNKLEEVLPAPSSVWLMTKDQEKVPKATQNLYVIKIGVGLTADNNVNNLTFLYNKFYNNQKVILTRKEQLLKEIAFNKSHKKGSL